MKTQNLILEGATLDLEIIAANDVGNIILKTKKEAEKMINIAEIAEKQLEIELVMTESENIATTMIEIEKKILIFTGAEEVMAAETITKKEKQEAKMVSYVSLKSLFFVSTINIFIHMSNLTHVKSYNVNLTYISTFFMEHSLFIYFF